MGVWALPKKAKQAKELRELFKKPILAKEASDKIYDIIGCDDLFDNILENKERFGDDDDVRVVIACSLENFLEGDLTSWSKESVKICRKICDKINEMLELRMKFPNCAVAGFDF